MRWLPAVLALHLQGKTGRIWEFTYKAFADSFRLACSALAIKLVPYQARHSGASIDRFSESRSLLEVQKRGFWKSVKSLTRYEKAGRLVLSWQKHSTEQQQQFEAAERVIGEAMCNRPARPGILEGFKQINIDGTYTLL
jgi:hypothetical protein